LTQIPCNDDQRLGKHAADRPLNAGVIEHPLRVRPGGGRYEPIPIIRVRHQDFEVSRPFFRNAQF
jgi:hypothetical protein